MSCQTLKVLLYYLAKHKTSKLAKFCCNNSCLVFTKLANSIGKINYTLCGVKLNAQDFTLSHEYPHRDVCATYNLRHWWHRWGEMQQQVYQVHDVDELKQRSIDVWHGFQQCHQCVKVWKFEHLVQLHIMHILFCLSHLLILWTLNNSYCVTCSRILPVLVFCILHCSRVAHLKCGEMYDMDFVANFTANMTVKKFLKSVNFSNLWTNV